MSFEAATPAVIDEIEARLEADLPDLPTLEAAAQRTCEVLYQRFRTAVLVRAFATARWGDLPENLRNVAARGLALHPGTPAPVDAMPVLALVGTAGRETAWNSRHMSAGHAAVPLASGEFVESIPMIARLLQQLGARVAPGPELDTTMVTQSIGSAAGAFYVADARTETDDRGRRVITARDFVEKHGVRTVFGFGGSYAVSRTFLVIVVFTAEAVSQRSVERFMRLTNVVKALTMRQALSGAIFADGPGARRLAGGARRL